LAALLAVVLLRAPIAEAILTHGLKWRGLDAGLHVAVLDFDRAVIEGLRIGPPDSPIVAAKRIESRYGLPGIFSGRVRTLSIEGLEIRIATGGRGLRLAGLPLALALREGSAARPRRAPEVAIPDGRVYITTPAGQIAAALSLVGGPDKGWTVRLTAQPTTLRQEEATLELAAGGLEASVQGSALTIDGVVRLASYQAGNFRARDVAGDLHFNGAYSDAPRLDGLAGDGALTVSIGEAGLDPDAASRWAGALAPPLSGAVGDALGPHMDALRAALADAFARMSGTAALSIAVADGRATAKPVAEAALVSQSGLRLAIGSATDIGGALAYNSRSGEASARDLNLTATVPGALDLRGILSTASLKREQSRSLGEASLTLSVAPWEVSGLSLAAEAPRLHLACNGRTWSAELETELHASGARLGASVDDGAARLNLALSWDEHGVSFKPQADAPQRVSARTLKIAGLSLQDFKADAAALRPAGPIVGVDSDGVRFEARLSEARAAVSVLGGLTALAPAAEIQAHFPPGGRGDVAAYIQAPRLEGHLGGKSAVLQASVLDGSLSSGHGSLRFEDLTLTGAAVPVRISHAAGKLEATMERGAPRDGRLTLTGAEVADSASPARVVSLTVNGEAPFADGVLQGALVGSEPGGREIARAQLRHNFSSGDGALAIATPELVFDPHGLQPGDLFPGLRGPVADASGSAALEAEVSWSREGLKSDGLVTLANLAVDTRFGRIGGVTTHFHVADLLSAKTDQPQLVNIGVIDPGLPLRDGTAEVELEGPTRVRLASVHFPFAGGEIAAIPGDVDWSSGPAAVELVAKGISLQSLSAMFRSPELVVSGSISGTIPLELRGGSAVIKNGQLISDAPGALAYTGRAGEGLAQQDDRAKLAFDAISNFQYDRLKLTLNGDVAGRLGAKVRLEGRNPNLLDGYPVIVRIDASAAFSRLLTRAFEGVSLRAFRRGAEIMEDAPPKIGSEAAPGIAPGDAADPDADLPSVIEAPEEEPLDSDGDGPPPESSHGG
jgi:hypothetical protein